MPINIQTSIRCTSKSLADEQHEGSADQVSVEFQPAGDHQAGSLEYTLPVAEDKFVIGAYYDITMAESAGEHETPEGGRAQQLPAHQPQRPGQWPQRPGQRPGQLPANPPQRPPQATPLPHGQPPPQPDPHAQVPQQPPPAQPQR